MEPRRPWIEIRVGVVVATLLAIAVLLAIVSFTGRALDFPERCVAHKVRCFLVQVFDVDRENTIPTWWSSVLLMVGGLLAGLAAAESGQRRSRAAPRWLLLSLLLALASLDEIISLHERMSPLMRAHFAAISRVVGHAWVVPGLLIAATAAVALLPLLRDVSPRVRAWMIGAATVYCSGALGMELLDGASRRWREETSLLRLVFPTVEELLELAGASLIIGMLLVHLGERVAGVRVAGGPGTSVTDGDSDAVPRRAVAALRRP
jgi:hypothetical protein